MRGDRLAIAYVHYGVQSGVTGAIAGALGERGHDVRLVAATGELEPRDPATRRLRPGPRVLAHLALAAARFGALALEHRWNTTYAWDHHARAAGEALRAARPTPDLVLQNGALFAPGLPPPFPYALLLDHTRALAQASPAWPRAGLAAPPDYGPGWRAREAAVYRGARVIAAFSENVARSLARDYGVDPARVAVVGAGANVFPPEAPRRDDGRTVLFVGKDFGRKGGPILLDAFARVRRRVPRARLLIAGPRHAPALPEGAFHLGPVGLDELPALLSQATRLRPAHAARAVRARLPRRDGLRRALRRHPRRGGAGDHPRRRDGPARAARRRGGARGRARAAALGATRARASWARAGGRGSRRASCGGTWRRGSSGR